MIHGYDDSTKEKVEVYSTEQTYNKDELYTRSQTSALVNTRVKYADRVTFTRSASLAYLSNTSIDINRSELENVGITDITEWRVINIESDNGEPNTMNPPWYSNNNLYPLYRIYTGSTPFIRLYIANLHGNATTTVTVRITLEKIVSS